MPGHQRTRAGAARTSIGSSRWSPSAPARSNETQSIEPPSGFLWGALLLGSFLFIAAALTLEVLAGEGAASSAAAAPRFIPLTWAQPVRVVWWLGVAAAAVTFRVSLRRVGFGARRAADIATVAPFLIFATGIAFGADWAAWH